MLQRLVDFISQQHLFSTDEEVLLAVSGGRDSVAMAHLLHRADYRFAIAHCNFNLRPVDCDRDQLFVSRLASDLGVPFHVASFDTRGVAASRGQSIEEAARMLRYDFFADTCRAEGYSCVATAHHADDSVETFFLNLFRGTGLSGLHGILPMSHYGDLSVVHPMLCFSRADIDAYVLSNALQYVEDITNSVPEVQRNRIRLQLMPLLRSMYPSVDATMVANIGRLADADLLVGQRVDELRAELVHPYVPRLSTVPFAMESVCLADLPARPRNTVLFELLRPYGFNASTVDDMLSATATGNLFYSATHVAELHRGLLLLAPRVQAVTPVVCETPVDGPGWLPSDDRSIVVDASLLHRPLSVRPWAAADRFYPFGMKQSRLISDFLKDLHLSRIEKEHVHLLCDADGRVVWVVGLRADNRFRVSDSAKNIARIALV